MISLGRQTRMHNRLMLTHEPNLVSRNGAHRGKTHNPARPPRELRCGAQPRGRTLGTCPPCAAWPAASAYRSAYSAMAFVKYCFPLQAVLQTHGLRLSQTAQHFTEALITASLPRARTTGLCTSAPHPAAWPAADACRMAREYDCVRLLCKGVCRAHRPHPTRCLVSDVAVH